MVVIGVADMVASNDPNADLVTYSLGSCLGVTVYDPVTKVGGMLHLMLPDSSIDSGKGRSSPYMFVDTGVPRLFHTVYGFGGEKHRLVVKVAGGALFLDAARRFNIGERNLEALQATLANAGHGIHARDTGGTSSRTLRIELASGAVSVQTPGRPAYRL
jgi:chemotaxis protein CheD